MAQRKSPQWLKEVLGRYKYVAAVVGIGIVLLLLPGGSSDRTVREGSGGTGTCDADETRQSLAETESRMQEILSQVEGVGRLELMLTVESGPERRLAQDTELSYQGETAAPDDYTRRSETVLVSGGSGEEPVVTGTLGPVYRGALVVCEGADRAEVKLAVTQAVAALTGLSSDRISVVLCQS